MFLGTKNIRPTVYVLLVAALAISCIKPVYPHEMFMQHSLTAVGLIILFFNLKSRVLSDASFICVAVFLLLHITGARWIYSYVPYNQWIISVTGFDLNAYAGFTRNHYDRLVHLMFGILLFGPMADVIRYKWRINDLPAFILSFCLILSLSLLYEVGEWFITLVLSPADAESYNGQQGDLWDAQKDMALAAMGGVAMLLFVSIKMYVHKRRASHD